MTDASAGTLLNELNGKRRRWPSVPFVFAFPLLCFLFLLFSQNSIPPSPATVQFATAWFDGALIAFIPLLIVAFLWDRRRFCVVMYSLDDQAIAAYQTLHNAFAALAASAVIWHVRARAAVYDRKYTAGASTLLDVHPTRADKQEPPLVRTNLETVSVVAGSGTRLCFFPDRLLIFGPHGVGAVNYRDLQMQYTETQFILNTSAPRDARVVDWTWQYVNKKGGPDRRFAHNPRLPIIHCERLHFMSPSGLNEMFQFSRPGAAMGFEQAVRQLTGVLNALPAAPSSGLGIPSSTQSPNPVMAEPPERAPSPGRTILALCAFGIIAFIAWAAGTSRKNTASVDAGSTPALMVTPLSATEPKIRSMPATQALAVSAATPSPPNVPVGLLPTPIPVIPAPPPSPGSADFNRLVNDSQHRAIATYPALGQLGSPINSLFVKRYTALKAAASPRLNEPDWPEKLARQCSGELTRR